MMLCSLLLDRVYATLLELNYRSGTVSAYLRKGLTGSPWNQLRAIVSDPEYRGNLLQAVVSMAASHRWFTATPIPLRLPLPGASILPTGWRYPE